MGSIWRGATGGTFGFEDDDFTVLFGLGLGLGLFAFLTSSPRRSNISPSMTLLRPASKRSCEARSISFVRDVSRNHYLHVDDEVRLVLHRRETYHVL